MKSKDNTTSKTDETLDPAPDTGGVDPTYFSPPLDVRSTVSNHLDSHPTNIIALTSAFSRNNPIPEANNNPVDPTEVFKTIVYDIIEAIPFLISSIPYEPKTVLLQLEDIKQEPNNSDTKYKSVVPHSNKERLLAIYAPLNILTGHLKNHQIHSSTDLNINPVLKYEATLKTHRLQKTKNNMAGDIPPSNPGGSCTMIPSSDVRIT